MRIQSFENGLQGKGYTLLKRSAFQSIQAQLNAKRNFLSLNLMAPHKRGRGLKSVGGGEEGISSGPPFPGSATVVMPACKTTNKISYYSPY